MVCKSLAVAVGVVGALLAGTLAEAARLLVDDFSIPQGPVTSTFEAVSDIVYHDDLFQNGRQILSGAGSPNEPYSIEVTDGKIVFSTDPAMLGSGFVSWPFAVNRTNFDLTPYKYIEFEVAEVIGVVDFRLTYATNFIDTDSVDTTIDAPGLYRIRIPEHADTALTRSFSLSPATLVGSSIAFANVWLVIPEPLTSTMAFACLMHVAFTRRCGNQLL